MKVVAGIAGSVIGLCMFLALLALQVLPNIRGPVLGNSAATVAVLGCLGGAALFVGAWVVAASAWRSLSLYRSGVFARGTVERVSTRGLEEEARMTIHWNLHLRSGPSFPMRTSLRLPRSATLTGGPRVGGMVAVLYPQGRPQAAQPIGKLGLVRSWHMVPEIQPPRWFNLFRFAGVILASLLGAVAITGLTANRTLDPGFLRPWTWITVAAAVVITVPTWLALRRFGPWLRVQSWVWLMGAFFAACMGAMGAVSCANVWFTPDPPRIVRTRVLHMDDEYFPGWHRAAFVRSWREGRFKERIPLHWRMGLSVFPGDELIVVVKNGALGWPFIAEVRRR
ncbi:MAG: hypothetical protein JRG91_20650 [Deltaproteobacteria bacterium]|nr:hypothetical protein [Deltaproteobacteria bacterium]